MNGVHFSSERQDWATPQAFFDALHAEFGFTLDACATDENAKCERYFTIADNALWQRWEGVIWMNPPYGHGIGDWIRKAFGAAQDGATVVALIPARTDTAWWHECVMRAAEIRFVRGRLQFTNAAHDGLLDNAPFPCAVVVFRPGDHLTVFSTIERDGSTVDGAAPMFAAVEVS